MLSEEGRQKISKSSKLRQFNERESRGYKILEIYLDDFSYYVYKSANEYLENRKVNWTKIKRVLIRNKKYVDRNVAPKHLTETTTGCWSCFIDNDNIINYITLIKNRKLKLMQFHQKSQIKKLNQQFELLYEQWSQIIKTSKQFPVTTAEVLDEFYSNNPEFLIAKNKTEKRKLFINKHFSV